MSKTDKEVAKEHAGRAAKQIKHAVTNAGAATGAVADVVKDEVAEKVGRVGNDTVAAVARSNENAISLGLGVAISRQMSYAIIAGATGLYAYRRLKPLYEAKKAEKNAKEVVS